jgi:hypothetical protein
MSGFPHMLPYEFCRKLKRSARKRGAVADYPTFRDAMTDLLRAWVAVNRAGVRA